MRNTIASSATAVIMLFLSLSQLAAQRPDARRADRLEARAMIMQEDRTRVLQAAELYLQAAALRGPEHPRTVKCLTMAAHLQYYGKRSREALRAMEQSAATALHQGDVAAAAQSYVMAAWLAQVQGRTGDSQRLGHRAEVLAGSPLLAAADRQTILHGITRGTAISSR